MNQLTLVGTVRSAPRNFPSGGVRVCKFSLEADGQVFDVAVWGDNEHHNQQAIAVGDTVIVVGPIRIGSYTSRSSISREPVKIQEIKATAIGIAPENIVAKIADHSQKAVDQMRALDRATRGEL